jgi:hypothetical protein
MAEQRLAGRRLPPDRAALRELVIALDRSRFKAEQRRLAARLRLATLMGWHQ